MDFKGVFNSSIEVEIMTTNLLNSDEVIFTTKDIRNHDPERLVRIILASSALPARFPYQVIDGLILSDAEIRTPLPIHRLLSRCDIILIPYYIPFKETRPLPETWIEHLSYTWDIGKAQIGRHTHRDYHRLERVDKHIPPIYFIQTKEEVPHQTLQDFNNKALARSVDIGYRAVMSNLEEIGKKFGIALERKIARQNLNTA